ncbi:Gfo/Idh/MocA family oxidoreductase [Sediminivirga luteola]|uniref:Inositol 2-dehydrogenase n=1 Tax=Sediminivirga luteola TaxID=1774748 RepID=A0A8J2TXJ2_9MICO|nr:Gfo/Idh/MocA family oxidoreductase [Sediminivirga luteola]MCI2266593.1 Gfo/Idh/MocA family oxidoreductase [Sediminivirga luteola]GGA12792.1 inositol 2-dehydrogenase [Sediminivirga luteola]
MTDITTGIAAAGGPSPGNVRPAGDGVRVGVIGAGIMGADHARTLDRWVSGAVVSRIADVDAGRAAQVAAEVPGAATDTDAQALIAAADVDAVVIASHDSTHAELVRAAVAAGKPVLCEKPLAPTLAEASAVARDVAAGADLVTLGFMRRFDAGYTQMRADLAAGRIGRPLVVHSIGRGVSSGPGADSESAITNSAIHDLDIVPWLLGEPLTEIEYRAGNASGGAPEGLQDPHLLLARTAGGTLVTIDIFLNARYGYDIRCELIGETGALSLIEPAVLRRDQDLVSGYRYAEDWRPRFADAYRRELQAWVDLIRGRDGRGELATLQDGLRASRVADAAVRSLRSGGQPVTVASD